MRIFIDTSAFYALFDRDDSNHRKAAKEWAEIISSDNVLVTSNYIIVETFALMQNRLGIDAVRAFQEDLLPLLNVEWISEAVHRSGASALLAASRKKLSLVDCVSFEVMRNSGIKTAFAFDMHFAEQGFRCLS